MDTETAVDVLDTLRDILPPLELSWSLIRDIIQTASKAPRNTQKTLHIVSRGIEIVKALRIPFSEPPISLGQFMDAMESLRKLERLLLETKEIVEKEAKIPLTYSDESKKTWGMRRDGLLKLLKEAHAAEFEPPEGWKDEVDEVTRVDDHLWVSLIAHDMWNFGTDLQAAQDAEHLSATLLEPEEPQAEGEEPSSSKQEIDDIMTTWEEVRKGGPSSSPLLQRLGSFMSRGGRRGTPQRRGSGRPTPPRRGSSRGTPPRRGSGRPATLRQSSASGQGTSKPAGSGQSANKTAASTQGSNKPATSRPGSNSPARVNQSPNKPAASTQGSSKPAASTQGTKKPAASTQGTNRPAASTQGTNKPAASTQGTNRPAATTQGTNKPAASTQGTNRPAATTQGTNKPAASTQGASKPARGSLFQAAFNRFAPKDVQVGDVTLSSDPKTGVKVGLSPDEEDSSTQPGKSGAAKAATAGTAAAAATAGYGLSSNLGDEGATGEDTGDDPQPVGDEEPVDAGDEEYLDAGDEEPVDGGEGEAEDGGEGEDAVGEAAQEQPTSVPQAY